MHAPIARRRWRRVVGCLAVAVALGLACPTPGRAQSEDLPPPPPGYDPALPDLVPDSVAEQIKIDHHWLSLRFGLVPIFDYTWFTQDAESVGQVGVQEDDFDIRSARILARGKILPGSKHAPRAILDGVRQG